MEPEEIVKRAKTPGMDVAKVERLGGQAQLEILPNVRDKQKSRWLERLHSFDSTKTIIS